MANLANTKMMQKNLKITQTLAHGYSSESIRQELSNEYQHDRIWKIFSKNLFCPCALDKSSLCVEWVNPWNATHAYMHLW